MSDILPAKIPAPPPTTDTTKPPEVVAFEELRRRQIEAARQRAFWAGRSLASRHSTRKAA